MTDQPKIELKSIKVHVTLSDETPAYTAKLYVDGVYFADVSNHGHGGDDDMHPCKSGDFATGNGRYTKFWEKVREVNRLISETYKPYTFTASDGMELEVTETIEGLCHKQVWASVEHRNFKSLLSRKIMFVKDDGKLYETKGKKSNTALIDAIADKHGRENILNLMGFDAAWNIFNGEVA